MGPKCVYDRVICGHVADCVEAGDMFGHARRCFIASMSVSLYSAVNGMATSLTVPRHWARVQAIEAQA